MVDKGTAATDAGRKPDVPVSGVSAWKAASLCSDTWFSVDARWNDRLGASGAQPVVMDQILWPKQTPKKLT
ncbi:hypothetical protein StoSoilA2_17310 [Arthrobacter sp. StoSoilA2]|nr:hypothetical protein StoSoilA2_17310 [Arthrobacter sp. StoSoilA2]BCW47740.1 hypothetical protein StoSoilB13_00820 [Arthrobacter sp. StoSoilB13]